MFQTPVSGVLTRVKVSIDFQALQGFGGSPNYQTIFLSIFSDFR